MVRDSGSGGYVHDGRDDSRQEVVDVPDERLSRHELDEVYNLALGAVTEVTDVDLTGLDEQS
ncbi:hypothetical protein [Micromonospora sp. NPDC005174]|uniref:hypothetical protein n=1 Tax=unclassified Micromonospora TaxID=2617518 RepID=UPI0033A0CE42